MSLNSKLDRLERAAGEFPEQRCPGCRQIPRVKYVYSRAELEAFHEHLAELRASCTCSTPHREPQIILRRHGTGDPLPPVGKPNVGVMELKS